MGKPVNGGDFEMDKLIIGIKGEAKITVTKNNTAVAYGSGGVEVFATPAMIGLMENAAANSVQIALSEGLSSVGTRVDIKHLAATPLGMVVRATSELIEIEGKRLVFKLEAFDEVDKVGEGTHERFVINLEKFMEKNQAKSNNL